MGRAGGVSPPAFFTQEKTMTRSSHGPFLAVLAALALAGCNDAGNNAQNTTVAAPDMPSDTGMNAADTGMNAADTGMNASSTIDMGNAGGSSEVMNTGNTAGGAAY
jgi:hypothetical protein